MATAWRTRAVPSQADRVALGDRGDSVTIILKDESGSIRVDLTSTTGQAYDWGKNQDNIRSLYDAIDKALGL